MMAKPVTNDSRRVEVSSSALTTSLSRTLSTFKIPESINSVEMGPIAFQETRVLFSALTKQLKANPTIKLWTPVNLFESPVDLAWQLLEGMIGDERMTTLILPLGYKASLRRWVARALNDIVGNEADDEKDNELMAIMDKMSKTKLDPKAAAMESAFDDILQQPGQTSLGDRAVDGEDEEAQTGKVDEEEEL